MRVPTSAPSPEVATIAAMITPALFILGSGSLIATVLARIGRIVELVRKIGDHEAASNTKLSDPHRALLATLTQRGELAEKALVSYYAAVVCFVLTCLLIGINRFVDHVLYVAPIVSAMVGVVLVLSGSAFMVAECRVAMTQLRGEIDEIVARQ